MAVNLLLIDALSEAVARFEGFYTAKSVSRLNRNPGNLRKWEGFPSVKGYARFPDYKTGWEKLRKLLTEWVEEGMSARSLIARYAPAADKNKPEEYAAFVVHFLELRGIDITLDKVLKEI